MKHISTIIGAAIFAATLISCSDDPPPSTGTPVAPAGTMIALLNGVSYASVASDTMSFAEFSRSNNRQLSIFGRKGVNEELGVTIYSVNGTGTYTLGNQSAQGLGSYVRFDAVDTTQTRTYGTTSNQNGTITISRFDTVGMRVSGSFKFTAQQLRPEGTTNTMTVLDGSFTDLPLTIR
jgi:hypothetical protein